MYCIEEGQFKTLGTIWDTQLGYLFGDSKKTTFIKIIDKADKEFVNSSSVIAV